MNILIVQTGFLGDVVLSTPVIGELRKQFPQANLSVLTTPAAAPFVEHHPEISEVLVFDKRCSDRGLLGMWRMSQRLKARSYDKVFSLHKSHRTAWTLRLANIPQRYGFKEASASFLYSATSRRKDLSHEVLRNLAVLRAIGVDPQSCEARMHIELPDSFREKAQSMLDPSKRWLAIAPGSVWMTKRWTPEGFAKTADHFSNKGYGVVLIGGKEDLDAAGQVVELANSDPLDLVGKTDLLLSAALISSCEMLITNDSAPLHIASARRTPVVATFCATVPAFGFGPWQIPAETVGLDELECRPCGRHGGVSCPTGTHACQLQLQAPMVIAAAEKLLSTTSSSVTSNQS